MQCCGLPRERYQGATNLLCGPARCLLLVLYLEVWPPKLCSGMFLFDCYFLAAGPGVRGLDQGSSKSNGDSRMSTLQRGASDHSMEASVCRSNHGSREGSR